MTAPRYVVTGANGFVGSAIVRALCDAGHRPICLVGPDLDVKALEGLDVEVRPFNLMERASLARALEGGTHLFHTAAVYRFWNPKPRELYRLNALATEWILEAALAHGYEKVVHTSSSTTRTPYLAEPDGDDEDRLFDLSVFNGHYKQSKFLAEYAVLRCAWRGLPVTIVHPTVPVGVGDRRPSPSGEMFLHFLNRRMVLYVDTLLNLVDVDDVAAGHLLAMEKGKVGDSYLLGGEDLWMKEVVAILADLTGIPAPRARLPLALLRPMSRVAEWIADHVTHRPPIMPVEASLHAGSCSTFSWAKAGRELGYAPRPAREAIEKSLRWYAEQDGYVSRVPDRLAERTDRAA